MTKITISEEAHHTLLHMAEMSNDKQVIEQAKNHDFSNLITAIIAGTVDTNLCIQCGRKLEKRWSEEKNYDT